jgi:hypothetical protein
MDVGAFLGQIGLLAVILLITRQFEKRFPAEAEHSTAAVIVD